MSLTDTSRLLIALAACDWLLTAILFNAAHRLKEPALTERATASIILTIIATIGAVLGGSVLGLIRFPSGISTAMLSVGFVLVSVPQFIWAIGLVTGRFR